MHTGSTFILVLIVYFCDIKNVQVHPDVNRGDQRSTDKFLRLRDAYTVLSSAELRHEYDMQLQRGRVRSQSQTYSSQFTDEFVPPKQSRYRSVKFLLSITPQGVSAHYSQGPL